MLPAFWLLFLGGSLALVWPWEGPITPPGPAMVVIDRKNLNKKKRKQALRSIGSSLCTPRPSSDIPQRPM